MRGEKAILAALADLRAAVARIEDCMTGGARDAADLDLLEALYAAMKDQPFLCAAAIARARQSPEQPLRDAMEAAQVNGAKSLGWALLRLSKSETSLIEVLRLNDRREGAVWQLRARVLRVCFEKPA